MRSFLLPSLLTAALAVGGCATTNNKKLVQQERALAEQNSRFAEQQRMRALDYGDVASKRGAEVLVVDPTKTFDPARSGIGTIRSASTNSAHTKEFYTPQKARTGNFLTRAFSSKANTAAERKFVTGQVDTRGKYTIPKATDASKTAETRYLWDADRVAATRGLSDGNRPYLGPESKKLGTRVDAKELANWRNTSESVVYTGGTVERVGSLKQLTIDDVRELLNKNK